MGVVGELDEVARLPAVVVGCEDRAQRGNVHEGANLLILHKQRRRFATTISRSKAAVAGTKSFDGEVVASCRRLQRHGIARGHTKKRARVRRQNDSIFFSQAHVVVKIMHDLCEKILLHTAERSLVTTDRVSAASGRG